MQSVVETSDAYRNFINSLDSEASRRSYKRSFPYFIQFCKVDPGNYDAMLEIPVKKLKNNRKELEQLDQSDEPGTLRLEQQYTLVDALIYKISSTFLYVLFASSSVN